MGVVSEEGTLLLNPLSSTAIIRLTSVDMHCWYSLATRGHEQPTHVSNQSEAVPLYKLLNMKVVMLGLV